MIKFYFQKNPVRNLFFQPRFFIALAALAVLFIAAYFFPRVLFLAQIAGLTLALLACADLFFLFGKRNGLDAQRIAPERLSNGDENSIKLRVQNHYGFKLTAEIIDEVPAQFQRRDFSLRAKLRAREEQTLHYTLKPRTRGEYHFGAVLVYASSVLGLVSKRYKFEQAHMTPVYPAFLQMRKYELYAISNRLAEAGVKKIRRVGHSMEFEHVRKYVRGDDYRTLNWKATARKSEFMANHYEDEKAQQVYCCIDMGRVMELPFAGMSLLDYAINASLVISNIALLKQDKAGVVTFGHKLETVLLADGRATQLERIMQLLYGAQTDFLESNFEALSATITSKIKHRSLILLFTNFETLSALKRQLPYLRRIARRHLIVAIFFENEEIKNKLQQPAKTTEQVYIKAVAEKFVLEKRQIVKELQRYGIQALLTLPQQLAVDTINKYLEIKARGMI